MRRRKVHPSLWPYMKQVLIRHRMLHSQLCRARIARRSQGNNSTSEAEPPGYGIRPPRLERCYVFDKREIALEQIVKSLCLDILGRLVNNVAALLLEHLDLEALKVRRVLTGLASLERLGPLAVLPLLKHTRSFKGLLHRGRARSTRHLDHKARQGHVAESHNLARDTGRWAIDDRLVLLASRSHVQSSCCGVSFRCRDKQRFTTPTQ